MGRLGATGFVMRIAAIVVSLALSAMPASAAQRVALVIGNGAYEYTDPLRNPVNDAADVAAVLKGLGFTVIEGRDLDRGAFGEKLREFARAARGAEAALFFYAGHGLQVNGENYLLPIDARLREDIDLDFEALELRAVLRQMRSRTNLVFLDACRDNPLAQDLARSMGASRSAAIGRGLGRVDAASSTLIAYATQPGNVAADGTGRNSPFTTALLEHIAVPGRSVNDLLTAVTDEVATATAGRQQPWTHSSLRKPFYFKSPDAKPEPAPPEASGQPSNRRTAEQLAAKRLTAEEELLFWKTVRDSASAANVRAYLDRYPEGAYAVLARNLLEQLENGTLTVETVPLGAQVRISGKDYRDSMRLKNGDYEVFIEAEGHEPFRSRLTIEGSTAYKISLCSLENETKRLNWEGINISFFEFLEEIYRESEWVYRGRYEEWEYIDSRERRFDNGSAESRDLTKKVVKNRARKELLSEIKKNHKSRRDFMISECNNHYMKYSKGGSIEISCYKSDPFVFRSHVPEEPKEVTDHNFACVAILIWECISDDKVPVCPETIVTRLE